MCLDEIPVSLWWIVLHCSSKSLFHTHSSFPPETHTSKRSNTSKHCKKHTMRKKTRAHTRGTDTHTHIPSQRTADQIHSAHGVLCLDPITAVELRTNSTYNHKHTHTQISRRGYTECAVWWCSNKSSVRVSASDVSVWRHGCDLLRVTAQVQQHLSCLKSTHKQFLIRITLILYVFYLSHLFRGIDMTNFSKVSPILYANLLTYNRSSISWTYHLHVGDVLACSPQHSKSARVHHHLPMQTWPNTRQRNADWAKQGILNTGWDFYINLKNYKTIIQLYNRKNWLWNDESCRGNMCTCVTYANPGTKFSNQQLGF